MISNQSCPDMWCLGKVEFAFHGCKCNLLGTQTDQASYLSGGIENGDQASSVVISVFSVWLLGLVQLLTGLAHGLKCVKEGVWIDYPLIMISNKGDYFWQWVDVLK